MNNKIDFFTLTGLIHAMMGDNPHFNTMGSSTPRGNKYAPPAPSEDTLKAIRDWNLTVAGKRHDKKGERVAFFAEHKQYTRQAVNGNWKANRKAIKKLVKGLI